MSAEKNKIINQLRQELPKHYNADFAQTVKGVLPSCVNCEFNCDKVGFVPLLDCN